MSDNSIKNLKVYENNCGCLTKQSENKADNVINTQRY